MIQDMKEKQEAIKSLLPLVLDHLCYHSSSRRLVPRYGSVAPAHGKGHGEPPDETWVLRQESLKRKYRVTAISISLVRLFLAAPEMGRAVYYEYVDPWTDFQAEPVPSEHKKRRQGLAEAGVRWMAREICGDVPAFGSERPPKHELIRRLAAGGTPQREIVKTVGCSFTTIQAALREGGSL